MSTSSTPKLDPAARPVSRSAFHYGMYSPSFPEAEMQSLDEKEESDLLSEIALTRFILARLLARMHSLKTKKSPRIT